MKQRIQGIIFTAVGDQPPHSNLPPKALTGWSASWFSNFPCRKVKKDNQNIDFKFATREFRLGGSNFHLSLPPTLFNKLVGVTVGMSVLSPGTFSKTITGLKSFAMFLLFSECYNINVRFLSKAAIIQNLREEEEFVLSIFTHTNLKIIVRYTIWIYYIDTVFIFALWIYT